MKFTEEVKTKWLEALESGKYVHGTGQLAKIENGITKHCCLGVFCELYPEELPHNGMDIIIDGKNLHYGPIMNLIGDVDTLTWTNDFSKDGYNPVIPLIKELKTVE